MDPYNSNYGARHNMDEDDEISFPMDPAIVCQRAMHQGIMGCLGVTGLSIVGCLICCPCP
jgi:hypothetical protein